MIIREEARSSIGLVLNNGTRNDFRPSLRIDILMLIYYFPKKSGVDVVYHPLHVCGSGVFNIKMYYHIFTFVVLIDKIIED